MKKVQKEVKIILKKQAPVLSEKLVDEEIERHGETESKKESLDDKKSPNKA